MGLAKDSGGGNGVPALSPPASCGAAVGKRAEEGQGLASQTWPRNTHTHPQIGGIPSTTDSDSLVTCQAVHHWICLKRWTLYAKTGGQGTFQRSAGRPEATRSPAPPLPPCRVPGTPPNPSNNWRAPSRRPAPCLCPSGHGTWGRSTVLADLRACGGPEVPAGPPWPESAVSPGGWAGPGEGGLGVGRGPPPAPLPGVWGRPLLLEGSPDVWRAAVLDVCSDAEAVGGKQGS